MTLSEKRKYAQREFLQNVVSIMIQFTKENISYEFIGLGIYITSIDQLASQQADPIKMFLEYHPSSMSYQSISNSLL